MPSPMPADSIAPCASRSNAYAPDFVRKRNSPMLSVAPDDEEHLCAQCARIPRLESECDLPDDVVEIPRDTETRRLRIFTFATSVPAPPTGPPPLSSRRHLRRAFRLGVGVAGAAGLRGAGFAFVGAGMSRGFVSARFGGTAAGFGVGGVGARRHLTDRARPCRRSNQIHLVDGRQRPWCCPGARRSPPR